MGWSRGSYMAEDIWNKVKPKLKKEDYQEIAEYIYDYFSSEDADDFDTNENSLWAIAKPKEYNDCLKEMTNKNHSKESE